MLEKGLSIDNIEEEQARCNPTGAQPNDDFYDILRQRARSYFRQEENWRQQRRSTSSFSSRQDYTDEFFRRFRTDPNPQPGEARRWLKQAKFDLLSAESDLRLAPEWICQKCFQVMYHSLIVFSDYRIDVSAVFSQMKRKDFP